MMLKKVYNRKEHRVILWANIYKKNIVIKNLIGSEGTLMHNARRASNYVSDWAE